MKRSYSFWAENFGRSLEGQGGPAPPLLVGLLLCLVLLFCLVLFGALLRLPSPLAPPSPWRLVVLISGSEGFPSFVSVWISGCFGNGLGVWPVCMTSCLLLTGLEMEFAFFPSSSYCMATKASALCGARPLHHAVRGACSFWLPPLSRLHVAPRHHSLRRSAACVPLLGALC